MKILALLDKPSAESFGMVAFVGSHAAGPTVYGVKDFPRGTPITYPLSDLIAAGHALEVTPTVEVPVFNIPQPMAAGWLGTEFEKKRLLLGAPNTHAPEERFPIGDQGSFWIASTAEVYDCLADWTRKTASQAIRQRDHHLAQLLMWALPSALETNATLWYVARDEVRQRHLRWQARLNDRAIEDLVLEYTAFVASVLNH